MIDRYAVFGNPIKHSKSPFIHQQFAKQTGQELSYEKLLAPVDGFEDAVTIFFEQGGKGANVTVPFKEQAFVLCNQCSASAQLAKAVNTLWLDENGNLIGDNTDGLGLVADLERQFGDIAKKSIVILGAGGAVRGCIYPLLDKKVNRIVIANRTKVKATDLASEINEPNVKGMGLDDLSADTDCDILINATSSGVEGKVPYISNEFIHAQIKAYDMFYGSEKTAFIEWVEQRGITQSADGLGMLVGQAAESFTRWRNVKPQIEPVLLQLRKQMLKQ
ncbi:shikimate dehydrogenase [Parashewanella curva]|uniref:Shikimate dehydrogenase (NADP(+)) n=1 Tax=Parashewanella curva TaxID=2338552 RepID=A0A3L8Q208_9GAMM|nr:shikimate dehydrogenase [Parashewanella curva]RLV60888.1 shikimate dehydrogenase [Parashewanella curva]